jgi:hypothetical protein
MSNASTERFFYDRAYLWLLFAPIGFGGSLSCNGWGVFDWKRFDNEAV